MVSTSIHQTFTKVGGQCLNFEGDVGLKLTLIMALHLHEWWLVLLSICFNHGVGTDQ